MHVDWCVADWSRPGNEVPARAQARVGRNAASLARRRQELRRNRQGAWPGLGLRCQHSRRRAAKSKDRPIGSLLRTTDGGKSFEPAGEYAPTSLPRWHGDALYWLANNALIKTTDQGATWQKVSDRKDGRFGPVFGKDAMQMFVLTGAGVVESTDGGANLEPANRDSEGTEGRVAADLARLRPHPRRALRHENDLGVVSNEARREVGVTRASRLLPTARSASASSSSVRGSNPSGRTTASTPGTNDDSGQA